MQSAELRVQSEIGFNSTNWGLSGSLITSIQQTLFVGVIHGAGVRWTPLRSRSTDRAGRRDYDPYKGYKISSKGRFVNRPYYNRNAVPILFFIHYSLTSRQTQIVLHAKKTGSTPALHCFNYSLNSFVTAF